MRIAFVSAVYGAILNTVEPGHPTDEELTKFSRFELRGSEATVAYDHLQACPACNARYRALASSSSPTAPDTSPLDKRADGSSSGLQDTPDAADSRQKRVA